MLKSVKIYEDIHQHITSSQAAYAEADIALIKAGKKTYQRINLETKELLVNNKLT